MNRFEHDQRVVVTQEGHPLKGLLGTVMCLRITDRGAWVDMESTARMRDYLFPFPQEDPAGRGNCVVLLPECCSLEAAP